MCDLSGCHYVEIQKLVKSTARFFLIMPMTCILIYQGIAGQDVFTGCLLSLPNGYYLTWLLLLASECELFLIEKKNFHLFTLSLVILVVLAVNKCREYGKFSRTLVHYLLKPRMNTLSLTDFYQH